MEVYEEVLYDNTDPTEVDRQCQSYPDSVDYQTQLDPVLIID